MNRIFLYGLSFFVWGFCSIPTAQGQLPEYFVTKIIDAQLLPAWDYSALAKDEKGFFWIVAQNIIYRYDGQSYKKFPLQEPCKKVVVDHDQNVWAITGSNVYIFQNDYSGFRPIPISWPNETEIIGLVSINTIVYLVHKKGIFRWLSSEKRFEAIPANAKFKWNLGNYYTSNESHLFVHTADSIYAIHIETTKVLAMPYKILSGMTALTDANILVSNFSSETHLFHFESGFREKIDPRTVPPFGNHLFLRLIDGSHSGANRVFDKSLITTNVGLLEFDYLNKEFTAPSVYYKGIQRTDDDYIERIFTDNKGTIYFLYTDGIYQLHTEWDKLMYLSKYEKNGKQLPHTDVRCFAEDEYGSMWIGTQNGLAYLDFKTGIIEQLKVSLQPDGLTYPTIRSLYYDKPILWIGTGRGIKKYNTVSKKMIELKQSESAEKLKSSFIWKIEPLQSKNLYVATGSGYFMIDPSDQVIQLENTIIKGVARSAIEDSSRRIWQGTTQGIYILDSMFRPLHAVVDSFSDKRIASLLEWKKNKILIGNKGLYEIEAIDQQKFSFRKIKSFPDNELVYCMTQDAKGTIWLGAGATLYAYNPITEEVKKWDQKDQVLLKNFNTNGLFTSSTDVIYGGGLRGFVYFTPNALKENKTILSPYISSCNISGDDSSFYFKIEPLKIPYNKNDLTIQISTPFYEENKMVYYRYTVFPHENSWIQNLTNSIIQLRGLKPAKYIFRVQASTDHQNWFESKDSFAFQIMKPWWKTYWFTMLWMTLLFFVIKWYVQYKHTKAQAKTFREAIDYFTYAGYEHSNTEAIVWDMARNCISRLGLEDCVIYLADADQKILTQKAAYGPKNLSLTQIKDPITIAVGEHITGQVALDKKAILIADTSKDPRYLIDDKQRYSELAVPIIHDQRLIGVIDSEHSKKNFFKPIHLETLQTIANICAVKISRAQALEEIQLAEKKLEELHKKMSETQMLNLRLQMNPHFLFNALNSIQHLVVTQQTEDAYKYLSVFSNFLRSILHYADKTLILLADEINLLKMYVELEQLGSDKSFDFSISIDDSLEYEDAYIPPLIIQPIVENAIWHGLMPKQGDRSIHINIENVDDEYILCEIDDNGIGRVQANALKINPLPSSYTSKAISLADKRLKLLQEKTGKPGTLLIEDKYEDDLASGTKVILKIPFYNEIEI